MMADFWPFLASSIPVTRPLSPPPIIIVSNFIVCFFNRQSLLRHKRSDKLRLSIGPQPKSRPSPLHTFLSNAHLQNWIGLSLHGQHCSVNDPSSRQHAEHTTHLG